MPNHYLTMGLFAAKNDDDEDDVDFAALHGANLCQLVHPMPEELSGIVSTNRGLCRYRDKSTGEFIDPDVFPEPTTTERVFLGESEVSALAEKHGTADWYEWQREHWGVKWGTYQVTTRQPGGDGWPVVIEFQSAWGPPNAATMGKINKYLSDEYGLSGGVWIGHDPYDGSVKMIDVEEPEP